jgi:homoserine kinase
VAGIALRDLARNRPLDPDTIFHEASALEGHPDNVAPAVYGGLVLAAGAPRRLAVHQSLALALAIPRLEVDTREARAILPDTVSRDTAVAQAARAAALVLGLLTGNGGLVHFGMDDQLAVPRRKQLIPGFDRAARAGTAAGAFGVTISGSGSALVAVTPAGSEAAVAQAMAEALSASGNPAHPLIPAVSAQGLTVDGKALGRSGSRE